MSIERDVCSGTWFTAPWPGPGNSEGPPVADPWVPEQDEAPRDFDHLSCPDDPGPLVTAPWPGPGDSEGPVSA